MDWHNTHFNEELVVLDPYTSGEAVFVSGGCILSIVAGCLVIGAVAEQDPRFLVGTLGLGAVAALFFTIYTHLKDTVEIDFSKRVTSVKRRFAGVLLKNDVTRFEVIHGLVVYPEAGRDHKNGPLRWKYGLALVFKAGKLLKLTEVNQRDHEVAESAAERLADRIGCPHLTAKPGLRLTLRGSHPPELEWSEPLGR